MLGRITAIQERHLGSVLDTALVGGETSLTLADVIDLDVAGTLVIDPDGAAELIDYTDVDEDTGEVTLASAVVGAYDADVDVQLWPITTERQGFLIEGDDTGDEEGVVARVPHALYDKLPVGLRDFDAGEGETVVADYQGDELVILDVTGQAPFTDAAYLDTANLDLDGVDGSGLVGVTATPSTDGNPPASSPAATVVGGPTFLAVTWPEISNGSDPIFYDVHIDTSSGFTPSGATLYATVQGTGIIIHTLADHTTALSYGTTYRVRIVARDADGSAAVGVQGSAQLVKIATVDVGANAITASELAALAVTTAKLDANAVTTAKIAADAVTAAEIAASAVGSSELAAGAVIAGKITAGTIVAADIAANTITAGQIAAGTITATEIAAATITGSKIAANTITAGNITAGTITATEIAAATITGAKIAANTITASNIAADTITANEIAANAITTSELDALAVTAAKIAANTITASQIAAGTITATEIAAATITGAKIAATTITAANIAAGTITATEIAAATITGAKIAANTITAGNITAGTITATEIAASTITAGKLSISTLSAIAADLGTITAGTVTGATIQSAASGQRVVLDVDGLHLYDTNSGLVVDLPTDSTKSAFFAGSLTASGVVAGTSSYATVSGVGFVLSGGPAQPINAPGLAATAGGSLTATTNYWVSYSWVSNNELRLKNQADFEKDATTGITKLIGTETVTQDIATLNGAGNPTNTGVGYLPASLKVVTAATNGSGILLGSAAGAVTNDTYVQTGVSYTFSIYLTHNAGAAQIKLGINWKDASGTVLSTSESTATSMTTTLTRYTFTATSPASAVYANVQVKIQAATASTFWMDNAQLELAAAATTWVEPQESPAYSPAAKVTTTVTNKTITYQLPIAPTGAQKARLYVGTSAFNAGGASGIYQTSVAVSTSAVTTGTITAFVSTGGLSTTTNSWGTWSTGNIYGTGNSAYLRPAQSTDDSGAQLGWTLEGNGRIRFVGPTLNTQFWLYDDFTYTSTAYVGLGAGTSGQVGPFTAGGTGTASGPSAGASTSVNPGVITLSTGTTNTGSAFCRTTTFASLGVARFRCSFYFAVSAIPNATNSYNIVLGLEQPASGNVVLANTDNAIAFRFSTDTGATLQLATSDATGAFATSNYGTAIVANTYYFVEFEVDAARSAVNWWVNFVKQTAITTHIPASGASPMAFFAKIVKTNTGAGTANRDLLVDAMSYYGDYVSG